MAQNARPSADSSIGGYTDQSDAVVNIYGSIDEAAASDADYIKSVPAPSSAPYVTKLSSVNDPVSAAGHIVRYRYAKANGTSQINLTMQLRHGYVNEGSPGTLIAEWTHSDISDSWTTAAKVLSTAQADSITNYADLYLRAVFTQA